MNKKIKVVFFDSSHSYYAIDESLIENGRISFRGKKDPTNLGIRKLSSVGKFFGKYFPEYDSNYWLTYKGLEFANKKVFDEIKSANFKGIGAPRAELFFPMLFDKIDPIVFHEKRQIFADFWDFKRENSAFLGTQFHLNQEKKHEKNGFIINPFTEEKFKLITHNKIFDNESVVYNLKDLEDGAYSEILLFDLEVGVAGQVDELFVKTIKKKKNIWINDSKTNEEKPDKSNMQKAYPPLDELDNCKHNKYSMQLSSYAYILERAGCVIQDLAYTFYKDYNEECYETVKVEYFRDFCEKIFQKV